MDASIVKMHPHQTRCRTYVYPMYFLVFASCQHAMSVLALPFRAL